MSYTAALSSLYALGLELAPDPTSDAPRRKFDLAHMRTLCAALGDPQSTFPSVLIAGTNGKGSTAATLASILTAAGYRTALYTSPHLIRVNERIASPPRPPLRVRQRRHPRHRRPRPPRPHPRRHFARLYFQSTTPPSASSTPATCPTTPASSKPSPPSPSSTSPNTKPTSPSSK